MNRKSSTKSTDLNVSITKETYEKIFDEYASSNRLLNKDVERSLEQFVDYLNGTKVLDVGCAGGRETAYLANQGLDASGCDISPSFVKHARKAYPQYNFFETDMRAINGSEEYDGIWCNAAFLHLPKQDAADTLKVFYRLLKPLGTLYLSVMRGEFEGLKENVEMKWPERHFSEYTQTELDTLAVDAGFIKLSNTANETNWGPTFLHEFYRKA